MDSSAYFQSRNISVRHVPKNILGKARAVIEKLEKGQPYWQLHGKRLVTNRNKISIPVGQHWRILADDVDGKVCPRAVLSHQTYNKVI